MKATITALISAIEPIIPLQELDVLKINLPQLTSLELAKLRYFELATTALVILSATATENVYPGFFATVKHAFKTLDVSLCPSTLTIN